MPPQNVYFAAHSYKYTCIWIQGVFRPKIVLYKDDAHRHDGTVYRISHGN